MTGAFCETSHLVSDWKYAYYVLINGFLRLESIGNFEYCMIIPLCEHTL